MCVSVCLSVCLSVCNLRRIQRDILINVKMSSCKAPAILVRFWSNLNFLGRLSGRKTVIWNLRFAAEEPGTVVQRMGCDREVPAPQRLNRRKSEFVWYLWWTKLCWDNFMCSIPSIKARFMKKPTNARMNYIRCLLIQTLFVIEFSHTLFATRIIYTYSGSSESCLLCSHNRALSVRRYNK